MNDRPTEPTRTPPPVQTFGGCVIITGTALRAAAQAMLIAVRHRRLSGLPDSSTYHDLAQVFINMSDTGHTDVPEPVAAQYLPTVPIDQAARQLGVSTRQVRRLASQLGGRKIGNQWLLDQTSIDEHLEGKQQWTEQN